MPPTAGDRERGSALLLIPAFLLVLLAATALVIDAGIGFAAKRDVADAASAAANDAAAGLDDGSFYDGGEIAIDPDLAQRLADETIARRRSTLVPDAAAVVAPTVLADGEPGVEVEVIGHAHLLFARFLPDRASTITLHASARAAARRRAPS